MYFRNNDEFSNQDSNQIRNDFNERPMMDYYPNMYGAPMMPYHMMPNSMDYEDDDMYRSFLDPAFDDPRGRRRRRRRRHFFHHHVHHHFHHFRRMR
ncbi:hypothetical protein [uncultured Clostridium sp.]|uniref:hypothetical protein n=1 Tax=uncultured Clostridium sp. TaxID=59620 RepID=UPI0028E41F16|nr:hypothetical protein [uncultured Clostridium sp.]